MAILSVLGIYHRDNTIFDDMQLPAAIDRNTLIGNIVLECAFLQSRFSRYSYCITKQDAKIRNIIYIGEE